MQRLVARSPPNTLGPSPDRPRPRDMDIAQYRERGYTVLRNAFTPLWTPRQMNTLFERWKSIPNDEYRRFARMFGAGASQMFIFGAPKIQEAVRLLGVRDPVFLTSPTSHAMGVDATWDGVRSHQDWPALQTSLNAITVWAPYTKITLDTFPLEIAPGSHKLGILPAKAGAHYSEVDTAGLEFEPIECEVGDVVIFSVLSVHRTRTPGAGFRLAVSMRYEDASDPYFIRTGGYSAQRRVIEREIKFMPTEEELRGALS